ncbi:MAG: GNAT family N-acetyltransferase [Pseudomonadales bacterium]|nr:GNAT family N-acetyltransferase [Pseudomonadales bacterium]
MAAWGRLISTSNKFTGTLHPDFVLSWYNNYRHHFEPLLFAGYAESNSVIGLMPLAVEKQTKRLTFAGDNQAEYSGWLADRDYELEFPVKVAITCFSEYGISDWQWKWLTPGSKIDFTNNKQLRDSNIHVHVEKIQAPIIDLTDDLHIEKKSKRKSLKNNVNRLNKRGTLSFNRIEERGKFSAFGAELSSYYDLVKAAKLGITPFATDKHKFNFFSDRVAETESCHCTFLQLNNNLLAANYGLSDSNRVLLGLYVYNPFYQRYSPGTIMLVRLARLLRAQGYTILDLTPGAEPYKWAFANSAQELYRIRFCKNQQLVLLLKAKSLAKSVFLRYLQPLPIYKQIIKNAYNKCRALLSTIKNGFYKTRRYTYYFYDLNNLSAAFDRAQSTLVNKNQSEDLLLYRKTDGGVDVPQFVSRGLSRLNNGDSLYSIVKDNRLTHSGWAAKISQNHPLSNVPATLEVPKNSVLLYDFVTDSEYRRQGLYTENIITILAESRATGSDYAFIAVNDKNFASKRAIENTGFKKYKQYAHTRFIFKDYVRMDGIEQ